MENVKTRESQSDFVWIFVGLLVGIAGTVGVQYWLSGERNSQSAPVAAVTAADMPVATGMTAEPSAGVMGAVQLGDATTTGAVGVVPAEAMATGANAKSALDSETGAMSAAATNSGPSAAQQVSLSSGMTYSETTSGYPIYTGRRAVDSSALPVETTESASMNEEATMSQSVGRNGLLANPCVDPASSKGKAYSSSWQ